MRLGIISDVHANFAALSAALERLRRARAERIVCAGDVVGYGPQPNECVELLAASGALCVAGNHDLMALGELSPPARNELVASSTDFTRTELSADSRDWLAALPCIAELAVEPGGPATVVVAHGSLDDPARYVEREDAQREQLGQLAERAPAARLLVLGHTHRPGHLAAGGRAVRPPLQGGRYVVTGSPVLCNPGSVGQSRQIEVEPRSRFALVELSRHQLRIVYETWRYDVAATRHSLLERNLDPRAVHLVPGRTGALARRMALTAAALSGRSGTTRGWPAGP